MPEKMRPENIRPTPENTEAESPLPTHAEQNVLATLHEKTDGRSAESPKPDDGTLEILHKGIEGCESFPLLCKYASGELPTLTTMFGNIRPFLADFRGEINKERSSGDQDVLKSMESLYGLISGREKQVRGAIQRYVNSVVRFRHLEKLSAGGGRDLKEQFSAADHARRRAHNSLMESLTIYSALVRQLNDEGFDTLENFPFVEWSSADDARKLGSGKCIYFAGDVLRNRDFIRDWAIVADFEEQLELLGDDDYIQSIRDRS